MPFWYTLLLAIITPLYRLRVFLRSRHEADYQPEIQQRFGPLQPATLKNPVWIHAVSVGETNAAQPIIEYLLGLGLPVLVTNTTRTGAARVRTLFASPIAKQQLEQHFLPVDTAQLMRDFVEIHQPRALLMIETEIWPNLLAVLEQRHIPSILINARLSERSAKGYGRFPSLVTPMLKRLTLIAAQDQDTALRFIALGADADHVVVTGSLKFDLSAPESALGLAQEIKTAWHLEGRPVIFAASTHEPEEKLVLEQFKILHAEFPNALLIIAPRHPERFDRAADLIAEQGFQYARRSRAESVDAQTSVFLADSMGEMWTWYSLAQIAFVGGSFSETGGHNPLEAASLGVPVVMGPHTFNFAQIVDQFKQAGALIQIERPEDLAPIWREWLLHENLRLDAAHAASHVMSANRGALQRQLNLVDGLLKQ
ncbi:lipid IV(A) 3-deoxy-D-manno-octulosonic acid transferase [Aquirhabdus sp.]|uniref:lipid IV(A) 3-deoxy-D-manno-octulosonic acid transferase n=1 Tax=Aquirhabdus sp. TaxID=2824160 RepID=UPI00396CB544